MKKIQRLSLNDLKETCLLLDDTTKKSILGGGEIVPLSKGSLENMENGVQYIGKDGITCFFAGVNFSLGGTADMTAYQLLGTIHIDPTWINDKDHPFTVEDFAHEYGHFLQELSMGTLSYLMYVALPSVLNEWLEGGSGHSEMPTEKQATEFGMDYYNKNKHDSNKNKNGK